MNTVLDTSFTRPRSNRESARQRRRRWLAAFLTAGLTCGVVLAVYSNGWRAVSYAHCGAGEWVSPAGLRTAGVAADDAGAAECIGVSASSNFGVDALSPVMARFDQQNRDAAADPARKTVTVAVLTPVPKHAFGAASEDQVRDLLEGAAQAQHDVNEGPQGPAVQVVVANEGSAEQGWAPVVDQLVRRTGSESPLVAVTGLGVSVKETLLGAHALSDADIPMVGAVLTANGLNARGVVEDFDGGDEVPSGPIDGFFLVSPNNRREAEALADRLEEERGKSSYQLVRDLNRDDFYTVGLANSLQAAFGSQVSEFPITFAGNAGEDEISFSLENAADRACASGDDAVLYGGRASQLLPFLKQLPTCQRPMTVITGSDAANLDPAEVPAQVRVVYAALADPDALRSPKFNPRAADFEQFGERFHAAPGSGANLANGWAIMEYDAMKAAAAGIARAVKGRQDRVPDPVSVTGGISGYSDPDHRIGGAGDGFYFDMTTGEPRGRAIHVVEIDDRKRAPLRTAY
ncbi:hypothetical protein ABZ805_26080 [Saccharopolyspora sp. NPDC047091]|uniref:ABC transporter substrate-binding protein n=1 Tax=Saccharopolyspora sp. NPDC047091 TaxID=3155924 RepID=UPI0033F32A13